MSQKFVQVDAFTNRPFAGNPAAVCVLERPADEGWMQAVAREMNLSETAFLLREQDGFRLRWFTPAMEVDLCGHATLASAHVLWQQGLLGEGAEARFFTRSGVLTATRQGAWIEMDLPATPAERLEVSAELGAALGATVVAAGRSRFDILAELENEEAVRSLQPDMGHLAKVPARGVIVTSRASTAPYDFVSRFFAPGSGIPEDPVTGSAHCCLGPYWRDRTGKDTLLAYQASARGGEVRVRVCDPRVMLAGQAVTVLHGELV
ncbi:MAG TPA: PhzF family phenazine biosynthesis protein [Isosphaeraceae bacterium]|nr:PhzF family phenazine biosynthesis protein [Isosphaeraceae bacterium]